MSGNQKYTVLFFIAVAAAFGAALLFGLLSDDGRPSAPHGDEAGTASTVARPNVVLITIDTLRHDHLGCTGHETVQTPNIDKLASEGVLFEQALSSSPTTLPSHASLLTGTYPFVHGARNNGNFVLSEENVTLAEILRKHGYANAAFVGSFVLDSQFGLDQGFDTYNDNMAGGSGERMFLYEERPAGLVTDAALAWLRMNGDKKFFVWLHYYDPHVTYDPPPPYAERYADNPYVGEIAYTDSRIGVLLDALEEMGLLDNSIVVLTSDHGESLGEHGESTHGIFIYDSTLRVPLILRFPPSLPGKKRIPALVRLIDVMPTLLDLLEIPRGAGIQGMSLMNLVRGSGDAESRVCYAESFYPFYYYGWSELLGIRTERWKYVRAPKPELYDLKADPLETKNLFEEKPSTAESMIALMETIVQDREPAAGKQPGEVDVSAETLDKLRRLGYFIGTAGPPMFHEGTGKPDPKDHIGVAEDFDRAGMHFVAGEYAEAAKLYEKIVQGNPGNVQAGLFLAFTYLSLGQADRAMEAYEAALDVRGNDPDLICSMASFLLESGHAEASIEQYERAAGLFPENGKILNSLGTAYLRTGRAEEAIPVFKEAASAAPELADAYYNLGTACILTERLDEAVDALKRAVALDPYDPDILNNLGVSYGEKGLWKQAAEAYEKALLLDPDNVDAHFNLGVIHGGPGKDPKKARFHFNRVLEIAPLHPRAAAARDALTGLGD